MTAHERRLLAYEEKASAADVKRLVGRRIVAAEPRLSIEGERGNARAMHDWVLRLDDGTVVSFLVEEHPEGAEYGVDVVISSAPARDD